MSKPKLALIPSGYKSGKVYSILPNDATGDFDFTRQSIGTRVRKDGLIEEAKTSGSITNLILNSEDFSTNWTNFNGASISTDQALAPDGTNTADKIVSNGTNYSFTRPTSNITVTNAKYYTASIYVKADVETVGYLRCDYGTNIYNRKFDLSAGTLSAGFDNTANIPENERIEELANGWYRVSITDVVDTISFEMRIYCADGSASSGDSLFLWGAMVSEGALSDYIKTEGSQVTKRVETFTDVPRLDWYNSNCPSLLLEPQRTNLVVKSETLTNTGNASTGWNSATFGSGTISVDSGFISPTGELNAYKFTIGGVATGNNGCLHVHDDYLGTRFISAGDYSISVWLKGEVGGEIVPVDFRSRTSAGETGDEFTLTTEWKLYTVTVNKASASNTTGGFQFRFYNRSDISDQVFYAFGCQIEQAPYSSSYIKADNGSTVTRLKDECYGSGTADLFDTEVGVIYLELKKNGLESSFSGLSLSDGTTSNRIQIRYVADSNTIQIVVRVGGSAVVVLSHTLTDVTERHKIAFKFEADDYAFWVNGAEVGTDTSGALPPNLSEFAFDDGNGANLFFGSVYDARVYTNNLTDTELTELTTL